MSFKNVCLGLALLSALAAGGSRGGEIEFVTVGDAGNAPYLDGFEIGGVFYGRKVGAVNYTFRLGKYEITQAQYLEFLNAVDPQGSNALGLFHPSTPGMYGDPNFDGCDFTLDLNRPAGQRYALRDANRGNVAVWGVTWYAAARFCNWLHNGKGGPGSTEGDATSGAYDTRNFGNGDAANAAVVHNPGAKYWLPTFDEWFKAAYYKRGGLNAGYWTNPFRANGEPNGGMPSNDPVGCNAYSKGTNAPPAPGRLVAVGSYPNALSPYGCLDMGGNGNEWTELSEADYQGRPTRRIMGGAFFWFTDHETVWAQLNFSTHMQLPTDWWNGFRVAARPASENADPVISGFSPASPAVVAAGTSQPFSVDAWDADGDALTYSWKLDGTLTGNTGASMTYSPTAANAGSHTIQMTVSDGKGGTAVQSWAVTVTVPATPPSITTQPVSKTVTVGQTATFTVVASGTAPLSYQWQKNGVAISGATSAGYTTPATTVADSGAKFRVVATNSAGSAASSEAALTVNPLPTFTITASAGTGGTISPSGAVTVNQGASQSFTIAAGGGYQISGVTVDGSPAGAVSSYKFSSVTANHTIAASFSTVVVAPSITTQPTSATATVGQTATFSVAASGTAPLSYQWYRNGAAISGATSASYTTPATVAADSGAKFKVTATNSAGSTTSNEATLTVSSDSTPGLVTFRARDQFGADVPGAKVQVRDIGLRVLGIYDAGTQVQLNVGQTYKLQGVFSGVEGPYATTVLGSSTTEVVIGFWKTTIRCRDQHGADVSGAKVQLTRQSYGPLVGTYNPGEAVTLPRGCLVDAIAQLSGCDGARVQPKLDTGTEELVGSFWKATCVAKDSDGNPVAGAAIRLTKPYYGPLVGTYPAGTAATLPSGCAVWAHQVVGSETGARLETVFQSPLTEAVPPPVSGTPVGPSIATQPQNAAVNVGQTATFSVVAAGTAPLSYQWQKNGANISGATTANYTTPATTAVDSGAKFKVVVTNSVNSVTSNEATLTVTLPTYTITASARTGGTISPSGAVTVNQGASQSFTIAAGGGYQISGVTVDGSSVGAVSSYTFSNVTANHTIAAAFSTVVVPPGITTQPQSATVNVGGTATFSVVATGTAPLSYQWYKNGVTISGATAASYTTPAATLADSGANFKVTVTNSAGSVTSSEATLTVTSGSTPGLVRLVARDQFGADVAGAQVQVRDTNMRVLGTYNAGTQVQLTVGTTYRFIGLAMGVSGPYATAVVADTTNEVAVGFWKTTVRFRDQFGADVAGTQMRINIRWTSTLVGMYSPGDTVTLPRGAVVDTLSQLSGCTGTRLQPTFDTGLDELVGQFWKTTIRCRDQNGTDVAEAEAKINVRWTSNLVGVYSPGDTVTLPRGCVVDAFGLLLNCTGARTQPAFDTGLDELVAPFWKASCVARDANGSPVPTGTIKLLKPYTSTVVSEYPSGTVVTLPDGTTLWAYQVVDSQTGAKLIVTFTSPLTEVCPPAP